MVFGSPVGTTFSVTADGRVHTETTMRSAGDATWRDGDVVVRLDRATASDGSVGVSLHVTGVRTVTEVCLLDAEVPAGATVRHHRWFDMFGLQQSTVVCVESGGDGAFACVANPFGTAAIADGRVRLAYNPGVVVDGTFTSDALVTGTYVPTGRDDAFTPLPGRDVVGDLPAGYAEMMVAEAPLAIDAGARAAVRRAVGARVPWNHDRGRSAHWDWGENLYRVDPADPDAFASYVRMFDACAALGVDTVLVAPGTEPEPSTIGPWQHIMFLGMGHPFGAGSWEPGTEPAGVTELLDAAAERGLGVAAYTNPQYPWLRRPDWYVVGPPSDAAVTGDPLSKKVSGPDRACLGIPAVVDWLAGEMIRFRDAYDLAGFSFDFVFWEDCWAADHGHVPGPGSSCAQWLGFRELLRRLRAAAPDLWLEGLIGAPPIAPWGADGLTHPCPMMSDNQPQWVPAWPDLSVGRTYANWQRRTAYFYRNLALLPSHKVPGQVGHQANREHLADVERGWDWEGARYNLLSAIATGGCSLSVCYLPCWDEAELQAVLERDGAFFREWIAFARDNGALLARTEDLFGDVECGKVDGTIALDDDGLGVVFLANPDFVTNMASVPLPDGRLLRERYPEPGRLWGSDVRVEPHTVAVLDVVGDDVPRPALLGAAGTVDGDGRVVAARGRPGESAPVHVLRADGSGAVADITFDGDGVTPTLGPWRHEGRTMVTEWAPGSALPALLAELAPGVPATGHELLQPWSDPSRLRLLVQLTDPGAVTVGVRVDGEDVPVRQAYVGTWEDVRDRELWPLDHNLLGHYVDLTDRLAATTDLDAPWRIELDLDGAVDGSFLGVHVAHLPRRTTDRFSLVSR